jgi:LPS export ABC transporter protein LptC/lipopolysaccharide transport protein LptA
MHRKSVVYICSGFVVLIVAVCVYFFIRMPERAAPPPSSAGENKRVIVFKDVKYSGEKKGVVDWELTAKRARKYIDKPTVEMENIEGLYKPKPDDSVTFKGDRGQMDTEAEVGFIENVQVFYKKDYVLKTLRLDFDFQKNLVTSDSPVDLQGKRMSLVGMGLVADTKEQVISVKSDVNGSVETEKGKFRFSSDRFRYEIKSNTYIFDGAVVVKGQDMSMFSDKVFVFSKGDDLERIEAEGKVKLLAKGSIAKSEQAVYYFKDEKVILKKSPSIIKDNVEMRGRQIVYNLTSGTFSVDRPQMRIEQ